MAKFAGIIRKIELDSFGKEWEGAFLRFHSFTYEEVGVMARIGKDKENVDKAMTILSEKFINGMAPTKKGKLIKVKADELGKLPIEVLVKSIEDLGKLDEVKKD